MMRPAICLKALSTESSSLSAFDQNNRGSDYHHEQAQHLSHGEVKEYKSQVLIRLPEVFDKEPDKAVAEQVKSHPHSILKLHLTEHKPHQYTQQKPLKAGLVQLAWVPWLVLSREHHADRGICDAPVQLCIYKVADASEEIAERNGSHHHVCICAEALLVPDGVEKNSQSASDHTAVVGHPLEPCEAHLAVKRPENKPWVSQVKHSIIINNSGKNPGSQKQSYNAPGYQVHGLVAG